MDDCIEVVDEMLREKLYNFYCELGWNCEVAENLASDIEIPEDVLESFWLDMLTAKGDADHDSYMGK